MRHVLSSFAWLTHVQGFRRVFHRARKIFTRNVKYSRVDVRVTRVLMYVCAYVDRRVELDDKNLKRKRSVR